MRSIHSQLSIVLVTCLLACTSPVQADTFHVDNENGDDRNSGRSPDMAWKTLGRVNKGPYAPGDKILFKRNQRWRGTLAAPSSGNAGQAILFSAYGDGPNPVIMRTDEFSEWVLVSGGKGASGNVKIWAGLLRGPKNSWGIVINGKRAPVYAQYSKTALDSMLDGHFYCPLNSGRIYYRHDAGNPGRVELGTREAAILIEDKSHIVIDGIDAYGPGGRNTPGSSTGFATVLIRGDSQDITLRNMRISHGNGIGVTADRTTRNINYQSLDVHDNGSTGIYMNAQGGSISNSRSYHNGRVISDKGDRGGIGSFQGAHITIESNEIFSNGLETDDADFEISIVGTGPVVIRNNHVHDCIQGCIQIAEGGDDSVIAYNVISGYGTGARGVQASGGKMSGIRIGGGKGGAKRIKIYNNVIHGGQQDKTAANAALYVGPYDSSGLTVINNIFAGNQNRDIYVRRKAELKNAVFRNNIYTTPWNGSNWMEYAASTFKRWQSQTDLDSGSFVDDPLFSNVSGRYMNAHDFTLRNGSPAIDRGIATDINSDYKGSQVPYGIAPDIGAFEYRPAD